MALVNVLSDKLEQEAIITLQQAQVTLAAVVEVAQRADALLAALQRALKQVGHELQKP